MNQWALKMSSSKTGLLDYNLNWHSDFDECLEVRDVVEGQYCSVRLKDMGGSLKGKTFREMFVGVCVPKLCTVEELR
ncbi:unnamed protein product, partial [Tenebrio molitor]